jgi:hypothetical protein
MKTNDHAEFVYQIKINKILNLSAHVNVQDHWNMFIKNVTFNGLNIYMKD